MADTETLLQLRWGDMDINNHINNVQFARLFEEGRVRTYQEWFGERPVSVSWVIARQDIEFRTILGYSPDPVTIASRVTRLGRSSFALGSTLYGPDGTICALAETTTVALDAGTSRPTSLPEGVREVLSSRMGDPLPFHTPH